ncbi:LURP-one-related/scramblase family protein [Longimicrobium sp.]|uniref:LURP-one-related/scramblase family protein n=1 Tax=Longimicrobium sp. TaxID=2029185 RepID=UPI002E304001|nr:LURP-one-related family protein [Longimicrobium sp.]HEX6041700.1 LURP-one-related family protein [Longimicrobium sp.]
MARYRMKQHLISIGEDFTIEDEQGRPAFRVDGKVLRIRETFEITRMDGSEVVTVREKKLALRDSMKLLRGGETVATVKKALIAPFRDRFSVEVEGGEDLEVQGEILDHDYEIRRGDRTVARVSKAWFALRDTYGIDIQPGEDEGIILGIAVALDEMVHDPDERK